MRKEEIRGLVVYAILIISALIVGFAAIRPSMSVYGPDKMSDLGFIIIVLIIATFIISTMTAIVIGTAKHSIKVRIVCFLNNKISIITFGTLTNAEFIFITV